MWPSLPMANHIADWANVFFIGSLVIGVVSTVLIVWMSGVKEAYWEKGRIESAERVASLVVQGDQLRKDTAEANQRAKEADLARLQLEARLAPRNLSPDAQKQVAVQLSPLTKSDGVNRIAVFAISTSFEANRLANQIAEALGPNGTGWSINRYPVTYGTNLTVVGVGILSNEKPPHITVANELASALLRAGIFAFVIPKSDPVIGISVMVGDHP